MRHRSKLILVLATDTSHAIICIRTIILVSLKGQKLLIWAS